ncbi:MAG: type VI secretion system protein TssA [Nitrosomonas sp.]|nr:type VI secretion system protein TssA [Nitrosomonas sp.]
METVETLLKPVSEDNPCGENIEYDQEFGELSRDVQGEPERQFSDAPPKAPNWKNIKPRAQSLLQRSKDLNVTIWFTRASTHCDGIGGLLTGLNLIHGCIKQYWDCVYPRLDPEDNNDPEARLSILSQIGDYEIFVRDVHSVKLTFKKAEITIRDILAIEGKLTVLKDQPEFTQAQVEGIFHDPENAAVVQDLHKQLGDTLQLLKDLRKTLDEKLSNTGLSPDFSKLETVLINMQRLCATSALDEADGGGGTEVDSDDTSGVKTIAGGGNAATGEIRSREDVVRILEKACRYIERTEPTNPAALVVRFAQTLMTKNFVEIMEMLPPEDLKIFKKVMDAKTKK